MKTSMYYSANGLKDRDAMFNFIVGSRGHGKTFEFKNEVISAHIRDGSEFIYLRRYKSEFDTIATFFADIAHLYPRHELRTKGRRAEIREEGGTWRVFGYFITLSNALTKKSAVLPMVKLIGFDEFIIPPKGALRYLNDEVRQFLDFYISVDRKTDRCKVWFMANAISFQNPYFNYWAIDPKPGKRIKTYAMNHTINKPYVAVEFTDSEEFQEHVGKTRFAQAFAGSEYEAYAAKNEFADLHERFLSRKPKGSHPRYTFVYNTTTLNVYYSPQVKRYWMTQGGSRAKTVYALTVRDHVPNVVMLNKATPLLKNLAEIYRNAHLYFDNAKTRETVLELLNIL